MKITKTVLIIGLMAFSCKLNAGGYWTKEEDEILRTVVERLNGSDYNWAEVTLLFNAASGCEKSESSCHHRYFRLSGVVDSKHCINPWTTEEDAELLRLVDAGIEWSEITKDLNSMFKTNRTWQSFKVRYFNMKKTKWSTEEKNALLADVSDNNQIDWNEVALRLNNSFGNNRSVAECCRKARQSCCNFSNKAFTKEEDELILQKVDDIGKKWHIVAKFFQNRSPYSIKARYNILIRNTKKECCEKYNSGYYEKAISMLDVKNAENVHSAMSLLNIH